MSTSRTLVKAGTIIMSLALFLVGALVAIEAVEATIIEPAEYHFGSESMVGVGGWPYRSAAFYLFSCLMVIIPALSSAAMLGYGALHNSKQATRLGLFLLLSLVALVTVLKVTTP